MSYKDSFAKRNTKKVGEEEFEKYLDSHNVTYARYGFDELNKVPFKKFIMIPEIIRNSPDYMVMHNKASFFEVKCCRDDIRLKLDDIKSYEFWTNMCPLLMFLYCTSKKEHVIIAFSKLKEIAQTCEVGVYEDNKKEYYLIPWNKLDNKVSRSNTE